MQEMVDVLASFNARHVVFILLAKEKKSQCYIFVYEPDVKKKETKKKEKKRKELPRAIILLNYKHLSAYIVSYFSLPFVHKRAVQSSTWTQPFLSTFP